jgi:hypothetical protein
VKLSRILSDRAAVSKNWPTGSNGCRVDMAFVGSASHRTPAPNGWPVNLPRPQLYAASAGAIAAAAAAAAEYGRRVPDAGFDRLAKVPDELDPIFSLCSSRHLS